MANFTKCFFFPPTWDYPPPPGGPIKLGNVIASVQKPEQSLSSAPGPDESEQFSSEMTKVSFSTEKLRQHEFGIYTKFLNILGIGVDAGADFGKRDISVFGFDTVETIQFIPKPEYLEKCIAVPAVKRYLEKSRYRKPVYVITGLKIVRGAKAKTYQNRSKGGEIKIEADLTTISGAPIALGPAVNRRKETTTEMSFGESSDFIFAYRVRKILVAKKDSTIKRDEDYTKGAMLDNQMRFQDEDLLQILSTEEGTAQGEGFSAWECIDGDDQIICALS